MKKRTIALFLAGIMLLTSQSAVAVSIQASENTEKAVPKRTRENILTSSIGRLSYASATEEEMSDFLTEHLRQHGLIITANTTFYDNLISLQMALKAGDIRCACLPSSTAQYMVKNDPSLVALDQDMAKETASSETDIDFEIIRYGMILLEENTELYDLLNKTIAEMKDDDTIAKLADEYIDSVIQDGEEPTPAEIPEIEGADTITVAVTGDLPPMDYVTADGKAAGFNVAVLSEISRRANLNIELVTIESGARAIALSSGKADVVFWSRNQECSEGYVKEYHYDLPEGAALTEAYYSDTISGVITESSYEQYLSEQTEEE